MEKGIPYAEAWHLHPATALEMLGVASNQKKSNAVKTPLTTNRQTNPPTTREITNHHQLSDGRKLVAKYRKSTRNQKVTNHGMD